MIDFKRILKPLFVVIFGAILFFCGLGSRDFWGTIESRVAEIAKEMLQSNDWVIPRLNGVPRFTKPPLYFWTVSLLSKKLNGGMVNELLARIPSAFCSVLTVLFVFLMVRKLSREKSALISSIMLATSWLFFWQAREACLDMMLVMFITASVMFFVYGLFSDGLSKKVYYITMHAFIGLAVLTKGPVGIFVPWLGIITYLALTKKLCELKNFQWFLGFLVFLLIMFPWIYALFLKDKTAFSVFYHETFHRYTDAFDHERPFYFYLFSIPYGLLPWGILLPFCVKDIIKNRKDTVYLFCVSFIIPAFLFFSICGSKRSYYAIPLYPYFVIALSEFIFRFSSRCRKNNFLEKMIFCLKSKPKCLAVFLFMFVLIFCTAVSLFQCLNNRYSAVGLCSKLKEIIPKNGCLKTYKYSRPYIVYYIDKEIPSIESEDELSKELSNPDNYILMQEKDYNSMVSVRANVIYKYPNFTKRKNNMVLINGRLNN